MHDFFDVIGVPDTARAVDVRRLAARYIRRAHPDFGRTEAVPVDVRNPPLRDVAVDSVDPAAFLDRILRAFFTTPD